MLRKIVLALGLIGILSCSFPGTQVKASDTLGIVGTSLGGAALGLSAFNTWSLYRRGFFNGGWNRGGYFQPASFNGVYGYPAYAGYGNGYYGYMPNYYGWYGGYAVPQYYGSIGGWGGYHYF